MAVLLRIVSANLCNGKADPTAFAELVSELNADVVAVQELAPEQAEALAERFTHGQLDPARNFSGMGIALRRPGRSERVALPRRDARSARLHPAEWPHLGVEIEVLNVHVTAPHTRPWLRTVRDRGAQVRGLERYLGGADAVPRVLVGDLNATPLWPVYRRLAAQLSDAAVLAARRRSRRPLRTWGPWAGAPRMLRIDHALVSNVEVEAVHVHPIRGSDHSALAIDVSVPAGNADPELLVPDQ